MIASARQLVPDFVCGPQVISILPRRHQVAKKVPQNLRTRKISLKSYTPYQFFNTDMVLPSFSVGLIAQPTIHSYRVGRSVWSHKRFCFMFYYINMYYVIRVPCSPVANRNFLSSYYRNFLVYGQQKHFWDHTTHPPLTMECCSGICNKVLLWSALCGACDELLCRRDCAVEVHVELGRDFHLANGVEVIPANGLHFFPTESYE